jgi:hypothetical protein
VSTDFISSSITFNPLILKQCFLLTFGRCAIASGKSYSYILQFSVSLGQLYGTAVYFLTAYLEGDHFVASSYHYYVYYIGANASWVVIPSLIAIRCWNKIFSAVQVQGQKKTKSHRGRYRLYHTKTWLDKSMRFYCAFYFMLLIYAIKFVILKPIKLSQSAI